MKAGVRAACALALIASLGAACGKKGAPIPPIVRIPAAVDKMAASRIGNDIYLTFTVPATNIDESVPVDIERIVVYAYTGRAAPPLARFAEVGSMVATVPVATPPRVEPGVVPPVPDPAAGARTGTAVTIVDSLTEDELVQGAVYVDPRRPVTIPGAATDDPASSVLRRFYLAIPISVRGRPGPPGTPAELVLTALPDPPSDVRARYDASAVLLTWEPSGGLFGFLLDRALPQEPPPFVASAPAPVTAGAAVDAGVPPGPTTYNVYRDVAPDPLALPLPKAMLPWTSPPPTPINQAALTATSTTDPAVPGRMQCYSVRTQRGAVMSVPSARTCVTPIDVFPPSAPAGLAAVPSEGGISLIWEPNGEADLAGYLVLRRDTGDATLRQLTANPISEARYRDTAVQPGTRYIYSVVAVDGQVPLPNVSAESERVEETAR